MNRQDTIDKYNKSEKAKACRKRYYEKNKEKMIKISSQYNKQHKEQHKLATIKRRLTSQGQQYEIDYRQRPEVKARMRERRIKVRGIIHNFSNDEWLQKLKNTFGVCLMCNKYKGIEKLSIDHIKPISKAKEGDIYTIDDVQPLCRSCNASKGDKFGDIL